MSLYDFYIKNNVPALKNSKVLITKPYPRLVSNQRVQNYMNDFIEQMEDLGLAHENIDVPVIAKFVFYRDSKRRYDCDNAVSSCLDALTKSEFWEDDSLVYKLIAEKGGIDKENPGVQISIDLYEAKND